MAVGTPQSTDAPTPGVTLTQTPAGPCAVVAGRWIAAQLTVHDVWASVVAALQAVPADTQDWDLRPMQSVDHLGAQLLWNRWGRTWPAGCSRRSRRRRGPG